MTPSALRRPLRLMLLALAASACLSSPAASLSVGQIHFLGDSLSDCCVFGPSQQPGTPNWTRRLIDRLGAPAAGAAQRNLAAAGAMSNHDNVLPFLDELAGRPTGFLAQLDRLSAADPAPGALDVAAIWIGTNDIQTSARGVEGATLSPAMRQPLGVQPDPAALVDWTMANLSSGLERLGDLGFRRFLLLSPYDLSDAGLPEDASRPLAAAFSHGLREAMAAVAIPGARVAFLDMVALIDELQAGAPANGFLHLSGDDPCGPDCADRPQAEQDGYIFYDSLHLTAATHDVVAARAARAMTDAFAPVPAPAAALMLLAALTALWGLRVPGRRRV